MDNETKELQVGSINQLTTSQDQVLSMIERLAVNPDVDPEKLGKFMDLQERIIDKNAEQSFNIDMVKCQAEIRAVAHNQSNTQTRSKYADLEAVIKSVKPIYTKYGFALSFYEGEAKKENHIRICVDIMHRDGHTKSRFFEPAVDDTGAKGAAVKTKLHGEGSSITYARRYLTCMIFNIPTSDDDGNAGGGVEFLTVDQQTEIDDLVQEVYPKNPQKFWDYMGVESSDRIVKKDYGKALYALKQAKGYAK